jgi:hypothetical protein
MASEIVIYACDNAQKAATAHDLLIRQGFTEENIKMETADTLIYDAQTYDSGKHDAVYHKVVVIGRK